MKAYNPQLKNYKVVKSELKTVGDPPNIVFVLVESFGPSPLFYDTNYI